MARKTPTVWATSWGTEMRAEAQFPGQSACGIRLDSAAWRVWLEQPTTRSFAYPIYDEQVGDIRSMLTVRNETRVRGRHSWVAYRRAGGRVRKR